MKIHIQVFIPINRQTYTYIHAYIDIWYTCITSKYISKQYLWQFHGTFLLLPMVVRPGYFSPVKGKGFEITSLLLHLHLQLCSLLVWLGKSIILVCKPNEYVIVPTCSHMQYMCESLCVCLSDFPHYPFINESQLIAYLLQCIQFLLLTRFRFYLQLH